VISNMCQVITSRSQVIACRSQVASNSMSSDKHRKYHYTENNTNTRDRYAYRKMVPIQEIDTNTKK